MARTVKDIKRRRILADMRAIRNLDRQTHFREGGTLEAWRGRPNVHVDRKKLTDKRACRGPVQDD